MTHWLCWIRSREKCLQKLRVQIALKNRGLYSIGTGSGVVSEVIGLTDEQKKQLNSRQREIQQELQKVMAELKAKMEQEVLTESQMQTLKKVRSKFDELSRPGDHHLYQRNGIAGGQIQQGAKNTQ